MSQSRSTGITRKQCSGCLSPQRESKIIFILDSTPWIPDSRNWIPLFVSKTWILDSGIVSGFLDSLCCIPNSTSKIFPDSGVYKQNFPRLQIPDSRFQKAFQIFLWGDVFLRSAAKQKLYVRKRDVSVASTIFQATTFIRRSNSSLHSKRFLLVSE